MFMYVYIYLFIFLKLLQMRFNTYFLKNFENNPEINGTDPFHRKSNGFVFMSC